MSENGALNAQEWDAFRESVTDDSVWIGPVVSKEYAARILEAAAPVGEGLDVERLAWAILAARSTTGQWNGNARATEPTQWDRIMAKRAAAAYNDRAGTSSKSNTITDPARPPASPRATGRLDSRRD